jgi:hypothetical protein
MPGIATQETIRTTETSVRVLASDGTGFSKALTPEELRSSQSLYSREQIEATFAALNGVYANPAWITSLDSSKITGLAASLAGKADLVGGLIPSHQLPSFVDDVIEAASFGALPVTGETGKIYVAINTGKTYRWSGSAYVELTDATAVWGQISGTLSNQTDLMAHLSANYSAAGHSHTFASLTSKPTTLSGYGITDAYPLSGNPSNFVTTAAANAAYVSLSGAYANPAWITSISDSKVTGLEASLAAKADLVGGVVPSHQLPSFVDDVIEAANLAAFPATGTTGKIYVAIDTGKTYRWSGSIYVELTDATAVWGQISGVVTNQSDLITHLSTNYSAVGHSHSFASLTSKPTTLSGYGITDAYPLSGNPSSFVTTSAADAAYVSLAGSYSNPAWITSIAQSKVTGLVDVLAAKADLVGGLIPSNQLPSFVDDIIEAADFASLPVTGETGKIYLTINTLKTYRWSGSAYVELSDATAVWGQISGLVTNQTDLMTHLSTNYSASGHSHTFGSITSKPTTLVGYGITDAYPLSGNPSNFVTTAAANAAYVSLSGSYANPAWITSIPDSKVTGLAASLAAKADLVGGLVPANQLPSFVDDIIEAANFAALPRSGATGKIYVTIDDGKTFRWSGSAYVELTDSSAVWGSISGIITAQADLTSYLSANYSAVGHSHSFASLSSKPTTLSGYGITDAYPLSGNPSGFLTGIADGSITLAKMANVASGTVFYRKTNLSGAPEVQTLATLKTDLGLSGTNTGDQDLSAYLTSSTAASTYVALAGSYGNPAWITSLAWGKISGLPAPVAALTGTNSGDQTITLTGDVTGSGTGSFAATIANSSVTLAKMANVASSTIFYRKTAGAGAPEVQTLSTLKADLGLSGTNTGDQDLSAYATITGSLATFVALAGSYSNPTWITSLAWGKIAGLPAPVAALSGTNTGDQTITLTGDVTGTGGGSFAATIANGAVTLTKMANVNNGTVFYRKTAGPGAPEVQTFATLKADLGLTGTNSGDQTITLSGDLTGTGTSALAATIANGAVTLAKMADVASGTVFYRKTNFNGPPEVQTLATLKTDLGLTGTNSGDQTITLTGHITGSGTGSFSTTIADGVVSLAKMANVATGTIFYRKTAGTGAPEVQTLATLKADLGVSGTITGTNTGDQTITLTGDVTGSGTGTFAATIAAGSVSLAKMADVATATLFYRKTAGTGAPEVQTLATLKTDLGLTGTNSGDQTITLTGDVTGTGTGSFAATIAAGSVSLSKMADVATGTLFYRKTAGTGAPEVQTLSTLKTDLGLTGTNSGDQTITLTGHVTGSGTGSFATTIANGVVTNAMLAGSIAISKLAITGTPTGLKYLRDDGTWEVPSSGASGITTLGGLTNAIQTFAVDLTGTDFSISSSGSVHTFNLPDASATARGVVSTSAQTFAGNKTFSGTIAASNLSGTNTGDQTITLTGDVTGTGTGSFAATIAAGSVSLAKMANVATGTVFYRKTAGTGAPEVQTLSTLKTDLGLTGTNSGDQTITLTGDITGSGTGSFATTIADGVITVAKFAHVPQGILHYRFSSGIGPMQEVDLPSFKTFLGLSGTNSGDQTITLTGDVTGSGTGSITASIPDGTITLAKMANMSSSMVLYRTSPGIGPPQMTSIGTLKADLGLNGTNTGDQTIVLTGDVFGTGTGSFSATISSGAVTLAKMANVATGTVFYRKTAGTGAPEVQTLATLKTDLGLSGTNTGDNSFNTGTTGTDFNVVLSGNTIIYHLPDAGATSRGVVTTGTQTFAGNKTFSGTITASNLSGTNTGNQTITLTGDVTGSGTGSFAATLAASGVTPGTYHLSTVTVDAKGRVTSVVSDPYLFRGAADLHGLRNGLNPQTFRVFGTFTSSSNFEAINIEGQTAANFEFGPMKGSGGGTLRGLTIGGYATESAAISPWLTFTNTGAASLSSTLAVNGVSTFGTTVNCNANVVVGTNIAVTGQSTLSGSVVIDDQVYIRTGNLYFDSYNTHAGIRHRRANGTLASPSEVLSGDLIGFWNALGYHDGGGGAKAFHTAAAAAIQMYAAEDYTPTAQGSNIRIQTTAIGTTTPTTRLFISDTGLHGLGTIVPTNILDIATGNPRIRVARTPASAAASGNVGEVCWDANYVYVCTATNTWKRAAIATW